MADGQKIITDNSRDVMCPAHFFQSCVALLFVTMHVAFSPVNCSHASRSHCSAPTRRQLRLWCKVHDLRTPFCPCKRPRHRILHIRATYGEDEPLDIDSLAKQLSREAEKLRKELARQDQPSSRNAEAQESGQASYENQKGPFGYEVSVMLERLVSSY